MFCRKCAAINLWWLLNLLPAHYRSSTDQSLHHHSQNSSPNGHTNKNRAANNTTGVDLSPHKHQGEEYPYQKFPPSAEWLGYQRYLPSRTHVVCLLKRHQVLLPRAQHSLGREECSRVSARATTHANTPLTYPPSTLLGALYIHGRYSCTTTNIVYAIQCQACNKTSIGERGCR